MCIFLYRLLCALIIFGKTHSKLFLNVFDPDGDRMTEIGRMIDGPDVWRSFVIETRWKQSYYNILSMEEYLV